MQLVTGPGGDIFYVGYDDNRLHRIVFNLGNQAPSAMVQASPIAGASPVDGEFQRCGFGNPEGQTLTYSVRVSTVTVRSMTQPDRPRNSPT